MSTTTLTGDDDTFTFGNDAADAATDTIFGGSGSTVTVSGSGVNVNVSANGTGNDSIVGTQGDDIIYGGDGNDTISSNLARDPAANPGLIEFGDTVYGGDGNDVIFTARPDPVNPADTGAFTASFVRDTVYGGAGDDSIVGADANPIDPEFSRDSLYGGTGNDTLDGADGTDVIFGGDGNDTVLSRAGADTTDGGSGVDTLDFTGDEGAVDIDLGTGATTVTDAFGNLTSETNVNYENVIGSSGDDVLRGDGGNNSLVGAGGDDILFGGAGTDTFVPGSGDDSILGGESAGDFDRLAFGPAASGVVVTFTGNEQGNASGAATGADSFAEIERIDLTDHDDMLDGSADASGLAIAAAGGNDRIIAGQAGDVLDGGTGIDTLSYAGSPGGVSLDLASGRGFAGNSAGDFFRAFEVYSLTDAADSVSGSGRADSVLGLGGDDDLATGAADDTVDAGAGDDTVYGGAGNDMIDGGDGADTLFGGDGDDVFMASGDGATTSVFGGENAEGAGDTLVIDRPAGGSFDVLYGGGDDEAGTVTIRDSGGIAVGSVAFAEIENIVCFTRGTLISTPQGARPIESLSSGDLVLTRDNGPRPLRWIGGQKVGRQGKRAPVVIAAGALGNALPLVVSQLHRMIISDWRAELMFDAREVLAAAKHLVNGETIFLDPRPGEAVEYFHMLFDRHEIVLANGIPTESFHPGEQGLGWMCERARAEILDIFPDLRTVPSDFGPAARLALRRFEAHALAR